jgi:hypothetical protein
MFNAAVRGALAQRIINEKLGLTPRSGYVDFALKIGLLSE